LLLNALEINLLIVIIFLTTLFVTQWINSLFLCLIQILWKTVLVIPELFFGTAYLLKCGRPTPLELFGLTARITLTGSSYCKSLSHGTHEKQICLSVMY
jgi:hypothetical protein